MKMTFSLANSLYSKIAGQLFSPSSKVLIRLSWALLLSKAWWVARKQISSKGSSLVPSGFEAIIQVRGIALQLGGFAALS